MHISLDSALGRQRRLNSVGESALQIAPGATAAYSLRSLTGGDPKVVRVRRPNGDERDFTSSQINSGEMLSWVTENFFANDGFVVTWYDQSGNGRNAVQATAGSQPKIVNAGSLLSNGLTFDGTSDSMVMPSDIISNINSVSTFFVSKGQSGFDIRTAMGLSGSGAPLSIGFHFLTNLTNTYSVLNQVLGSADGAKHLISLIAGGSTQKSFFDGTQKATAGISSGYDPLGTIGSVGAGLFFSGQIEEVIIYDSDQSAKRVALETNIQAAYPTLP